MQYPLGVRSEGWTTEALRSLWAVWPYTFTIPNEDASMYALYAEDTVSKQVVKLKDLESTRFSRAVKQAKKEPTMHGCRLFVAGKDRPTLGSDGRAYLDEPAAVGSPAHQAQMRNVLQSQVTVSQATDWNTPDPQSGMSLNDAVVDIIRGRLERTGR